MNQNVKEGTCLVDGEKIFIPEARGKRKLILEVSVDA